jgi:hypothetical protein
LALGLIREQTGSFFWGFVLLAIFALICLLVASLTARGRRQARALQTA